MMADSQFLVSEFSSVQWDGPKLLRLVDLASGDALGEAAEVIAEEVIRKYAELKLDSPGGYHVTPGAMQAQVDAGKASDKAGMPSAGFLNVNFPAFQIEYGTARSDPRPVIRPAVEKVGFNALQKLIPKKGRGRRLQGDFN